jgi:chloride channel protein, CIC family
VQSAPSILRGFTVDRRFWLLSSVAIGIGLCATILAALLLHCIAVSTNIFYYHRLSINPVPPSGSPLGNWMVLVPVVGGLIVGLMARFGSDKIRGHGIPEAIEAILLHKAKVDPKIAILKPVSAAVAIGSGGPFGAEGPIIMAGGAVGSLIGQWMYVTDAEKDHAAGCRSGCCGHVCNVRDAGDCDSTGSRTFALCVAPRSLVPVAIASATAALLRVYWLGAGPILQMPLLAETPPVSFAIGALFLGAFLGLVSAGLSRMMYAFGDLFEYLLLHWMWWPAIGGVGFGVGGPFFPRGLGVGYDNIAELLRGNASIRLIVRLLIAKSLMWASSLGSGTSGGVLAPLLMIGGAVGAVAGHLAHAPAETQAFWALIALGSMLAGSLGVRILQFYSAWK